MSTATNKFLLFIQKSIAWLIIAITFLVLFLVASFTIKDFNLTTMVKDPKNWILLILTTISQVSIKTSAIDIGTNAGIESNEFRFVDEVYSRNLKVMKNKRKEFREYKFQEELDNKKEAQERFLYKHNVNKKEELVKGVKANKRNKKKYPNINAIKGVLYVPNKKLQRKYEKVPYLRYKVEESVFEELLDTHTTWGMKKKIGKSNGQYSGVKKVVLSFKTVFNGALWALIGVTPLFGIGFSIEGFMTFGIISLGLLGNFATTFFVRYNTFVVLLPRQAKNIISDFSAFLGKPIVDDNEKKAIAQKILAENSWFETVEVKSDEHKAEKAEII